MNNRELTLLLYPCQSVRSALDQTSILDVCDFLTVWRAQDELIRVLHSEQKVAESAMLKILHVIDSINPSTGGPAQTIKNLMSFTELGYLGEVVCLDDPSSSFLANYPFKVVALGRGLTPLGVSPKLDSWLSNNASRFDGVIVHGLWRYVGYAVWKKIPRRVPYVVFAHGMLDPYFKKRYPLKHINKWVYWLFVEYRVLRDAKYVLFTTEEESLAASQSFWLHKWNSMVVPYGASTYEGDVRTAISQFERDNPSLLGTRFLLFLGRVHRKKACDLLVRAFIRKASLDPGLHLVVAGPDETGWWSSLQMEVEDANVSSRVHRIGMLSSEQKWGAFLASEAFILPSHQENFGIAVAEALGCGRAVLISDKVNIASQVLQDEAGMVQPDTQDGTEKLISMWISTSEEERNRISKNAVRCFKANYQMKKTVLAILDIFGDRLAV